MTGYHIIHVAADTDALELRAKDIPATSAESAIRKHVENVKGTGGTYIAVPSRSWKPTKVAVETQTRIRIGDTA